MRWELAITISYPTRANGIIVLLIFLTPNVWLLQLNFSKFHFKYIKKNRPDINVTSSKLRENHLTCAPFANLVEWKIWKGRTLSLNFSLDKYCFRFPSLWLWNSTLDRSTWLLFNFVFFLHWIGAAQRPSFINQFVVIVVQWKAARCRIYLTSVMVRYGLAKVLRGVKALQRQKSANGLENLHLQGLGSHSENF